MKSIISTLKNPKRIFLALGNRQLLNWMSDEMYLKIAYRLSFGKKINLNNPKTFNEKLQWLKLYNRNPAYSQMVDKITAKQYVADIIGNEYIIPTLGTWDRFEDIEFDKLPNQFVLKCNHNSGAVIICSDKTKFDLKKAKLILDTKLKKNFFWGGREFPYKNVKPRILAESYMVNSKTGDLKDYKFFCFNGVVKFFKIDFDRFSCHRANYYDAQNNQLLELMEADYPHDFNRKIVFPSCLEEMKRLAGILSKDIPFLRVDFYEANSKIYFGELTFFPASGFGKIIPEKFDYLLGEYINLP